MLTNNHFVTYIYVTIYTTLETTVEFDNFSFNGMLKLFDISVCCKFVYVLINCTLLKWLNHPPISVHKTIISHHLSLYERGNWEEQGLSCHLRQGSNIILGVYDLHNIIQWSDLISAIFYTYYISFIFLRYKKSVAFNFKGPQTKEFWSNRKSQFSNSSPALSNFYYQKKFKILRRFCVLLLK